MTHDTQQVVLATGAGSGIGRAITLSLARAGHQVYASMRDPRQRNRERSDALQRIAREESLAIEVLELDVLCETACRAAVDFVLAQRGRIDV
jgi:NAD(P)-dependent dehydrogenase (short-subunit alcohol dehydrogenase family)